MLSSSKTCTLLRSVLRTSGHLHPHRTSRHLHLAARNLTKIPTRTTVRTLHASVPSFSERTVDSFDDYFGIEYDAQEMETNKRVPSEEMPIAKIQKEAVGDIRERIFGPKASVSETTEDVETDQQFYVDETETGDWSSSDQLLQMNFGTMRLDSMNEADEETEFHSLRDGDLGFIEAQYFRDLARDAKQGVKIGDEILHDDELFIDEPESEFPSEYNETPRPSVASQSREDLNYFDQLVMREEAEFISPPFGREPFPKTLKIEQKIISDENLLLKTTTPSDKSAKRMNSDMPHTKTRTMPEKKLIGDRKTSQTSHDSEELIGRFHESSREQVHHDQRSRLKSITSSKPQKSLDDFPASKPVPKELEGTAYELSQKIRAEQEPVKKITDSRGFLNPRHQVEDLTNETRRSLVTRLKYSVLYNDNDIMAIDKPYGLATQDGTKVQNSIDSLLPKLAEELSTESLYQIHRLDKNTTGVMLFAKTKEMQQKLIRLMQKHEITKKYWVLTKGVPDPESGIVDIPMVEGTVEGRYRMALAPDDPKLATPRSVDKSVRAVTRYRVLDKNNSAALVECEPLTGIKHQVRCHLSHGLNCPVLGDHKYSHFAKLAPQRLYPEILQHLGIRQSKVRNLPMHIHAASVCIPDVSEGRGVFIKARLPKHFMENMKKLKISTPKK